MAGYCNLHNHLLPGVDDGAKTLEDSLEMARALVDLGFTDVAPSPHARPEYASAEIARTRLEEVRQAFVAAQVPLTLHVNAENFFLDETLMEGVGAATARTLGTGKYLLIEAPYQSPLPALTDILFRLKLKGVTALIAHPERCMEFERKGRAAEAVATGARLQLDLAALIGRYGSAARKLACSWLDAGLYSVAATDMHGPLNVRTWVEQSIAALRSQVGERAAELLLADHPHRVLRGETLEI